MWEVCRFEWFWALFWLVIVNIFEPFKTVWADRLKNLKIMSMLLAFLKIASIDLRSGWKCYSAEAKDIKNPTKKCFLNVFCRTAPILIQTLLFLSWNNLFWLVVPKKFFFSPRNPFYWSIKHKLENLSFLICPKKFLQHV